MPPTEMAIAWAVGALLWSRRQGGELEEEVIGLPGTWKDEKETAHHWQRLSGGKSRRPVVPGRRHSPSQCCGERWLEAPTGMRLAACASWRLEEAAPLHSDSAERKQQVMGFRDLFCPEAPIFLSDVLLWHSCWLLWACDQATCSFICLCSSFS